MTIKQLYELAVAVGAENYNFTLDDGEDIYDIDPSHLCVYHKDSIVYPCEVQIDLMQVRKQWVEN